MTSRSPIRLLRVAVRSLAGSEVLSLYGVVLYTLVVVVVGRSVATVVSIQCRAVVIFEEKCAEHRNTRPRYRSCSSWDAEVDVTEMRTDQTAQG